MAPPSAFTLLALFCFSGTELARVWGSAPNGQSLGGDMSCDQALDLEASGGSCQLQAHTPAGIGTRSSLVDLTGDPSEPPAPQTLTKLWWLHVPKCGSSFATALAHYECSDVLPPNVTVKEPRQFYRQWKQWCNASRFGKFRSGHYPIKGDTPLESVVGMMREPRERLLSGYNHNYHNCYYLQAENRCEEEPQNQPCSGDLRANGRWVRNVSVVDPVTYAQCVPNCLVSLLTGRRCADTRPPDVELALRRVGQLGFIGLTSEWNLSLCLFHAKFGGPIFASELVDVRPGVIKKVGEDDLAEQMLSQARERMKSWPATNETRVYEAVATRFWAEIKLYKVDRESCQRQIDAAISASKATNM